MTLSRRHFLRSLGSGLFAAAAAPVIAELEPIRRFWQVGRNAPVGDIKSEIYARFWQDKIDALIANRRMYEEIASLPVEHGFTYDDGSALSLAPAPDDHALHAALHEQARLHLDRVRKYAKDGGPVEFVDDHGNRHAARLRMDPSAYHTARIVGID